MKCQSVFTHDSGDQIQCVRVDMHAGTNGMSIGAVWVVYYMLLHIPQNGVHGEVNFSVSWPIGMGVVALGAHMPPTSLSTQVLISRLALFSSSNSNVYLSKFKLENANCQCMRFTRGKKPGSCPDCDGYMTRTMPKK